MCLFRVTDDEKFWREKGVVGVSLDQERDRRESVKTERSSFRIRVCFPFSLSLIDLFNLSCSFFDDRECLFLTYDPFSRPRSLEG